jgi:hypothetical protein
MMIKMRRNGSVFTRHDHPQRECFANGGHAVWQEQSFLPRIVQFPTRDLYRLTKRRILDSSVLPPAALPTT